MSKLLPTLCALSLVILTILTCAVCPTEQTTSGEIQSLFTSLGVTQPMIDNITPFMPVFAKIVPLLNGKVQSKQCRTMAHILADKVQQNQSNDENDYLKPVVCEIGRDCLLEFIVAGTPLLQSTTVTELIKAVSTTETQEENASEALKKLKDMSPKDLEELVFPVFELFCGAQHSEGDGKEKEEMKGREEL